MAANSKGTAKASPTSAEMNDLAALMDCLDSSEPANYPLCGTIGNAHSTVIGRASALKHFNDFLESKHKQPIDHLSEAELCDIPLFQQFGHYLGHFARNKNKVRRVALLHQQRSNYTFVLPDRETNS